MLNISQFPIKANSSFTGKNYGRVKVLDVRRRGPATSANYVVLLSKHGYSPVTVPYSAFCAAYNKSGLAGDTIRNIENLFMLHASLNSVAEVATSNAPASRPTSPFTPNPATSTNDRKVALDDTMSRDDLFDVLCQLVRVTRKNPSAVSMLKQMVGLI
jgi:hypothetical protein